MDNPIKDYSHKLLNALDFPVWDVSHREIYTLYDPVDKKKILAWIQARPSYCDRGHWVMNVDSIPDIDFADSFPRYYMSLERAKKETIDFLKWRLLKIRSREEGP